MTERNADKKRVFVERDFGKGSFYNGEVPIVFGGDDLEAKKREEDRMRIESGLDLPAARILGGREILELNERDIDPKITNPQKRPRRTRGKGRPIKPRPEK